MGLDTDREGRLNRAANPAGAKPVCDTSARDDIDQLAALVVEDDAEIGELIVRFLKSQEMDADVVANGQAMDRAIASR